MVAVLCGCGNTSNLFDSQGARGKPSCNASEAQRVPLVVGSVSHHSRGIRASFFILITGTDYGHSEVCVGPSFTIIIG